MSAPHRPSALTVPALLLLTLAMPLAGQCPSTFGGAFGVPGVGGNVRAMVEWDPDGAGPQPSALVIGGSFRAAATIARTGLVRHDPATATWQALPAPPLPSVTALAVLPNGQLVAACEDEDSFGSTTARVATLSGTTWTQLGADFDTSVLALHVRPSGELICGGFFTQHGGLPPAHLARWTGSTWAALGSAPDGPVTAFATLPNGDLLVGGSFSSIGGIVGDGIAVWNGATWSSFGSLGATTTALAVTPAGDVFAGNSAGLQRWTGAAWTAVPGLSNAPFPTTPVVTLAALPSGLLLVGGQFRSVNGTPSLAVAGFTPATGQWATFGAGIAFGGGAAQSTIPGPVTCFATAPGGFVAGGSFLDAGGLDVAGIASWNGSQWHALHDAPLPTLDSVLPLGDGRALVGGRIRSVGNLPASGIAEWDGAGWRTLGTGLAGTVFGSPATALARLGNGDVLVCGDFTAAGGVPTGGLARWNPTTRVWSAVGGVAGWFNDLLSLPDGRVVVAGQFTVGSTATVAAIFDGATWQPFAAGGPPGGIRLARAPDGDVLVAGDNECHRWNGSQWSLEIALSANHRITSLAVAANGVTLAGGVEQVFSPGSGQRAFLTFPGTLLNGPFGSLVSALHTLPDGDVWIAGLFPSLGPIPASGFLRYANGSLQPVPLDGSGIAAFARDPDGSIWVAGFGVAYGGTPTSGVARLRSTCPALALPSGGGCGGLQLSARELPWLGGTQVLRGEGLPANALGVPVLGLTPLQLPLTPLLPMALPNCDLLVAPEALGLVVPQQGVADFAFAVPEVPSLLGGVFHQQLVVFEFGAGGTLDEVTATNRLTLVIGDV